MKYIYTAVFIIGIFLKLLFLVYIFLPIYLLLCPYAYNDDNAYVDAMNYRHHFEDWI